MATATMTAETSLKYSAEMFSRSASAMDQAVDDAAEHDADDAACRHHRGGPGKDLADDQTCQRDRDHAGAEVDVAELVVLTDQAAGERREGVGEAPGRS